jgi:hypothetical protein
VRTGIGSVRCDLIFAVDAKGTPSTFSLSLLTCFGHSLDVLQAKLRCANVQQHEAPGCNTGVLCCIFFCSSSRSELCCWQEASYPAKCVLCCKLWQCLWCHVRILIFVASQKRMWINHFDLCLRPLQVQEASICMYV